MRITSALLLFLLTFSSCEDNHPVEHHNIDTLPVSHHALTAAGNETHYYTDSLEDILSAAFNSGKFEMKQQDWGSASYYQMYWGGFYGLRRNGLTCAVTLYGSMTVVSSLRSELCGQKHNWMEVTIGDTTYRAGPTNFYDAAVESGMGNTECANFDGTDADRVAIAIAGHSTEKIIVKTYRDQQLITTYELGELDKKAFHDCVRLSAILTKLNHLNYPEEWLPENAPTHAP